MSAPGNLNTRNSRLAVKGPQGESRDYFVAFGLNKEVYAVAIRFVKEILQFKNPTEVPLMPPFVRGVINLRGAVVPVLDLSVRFGRPPTPVAQRTCVVILEVPQAEKAAVLGVMVDNVSEVLALAPSEIEPVPDLRTDPKSQFISGIAKVRDGFVILLDAARILSAQEVAQLVQETSPLVTET